MSSTSSEIGSYGQLIAGRFEAVRLLGQNEIAQTILADDLSVARSRVVLKIFHPHLISDQGVFSNLQNLVLAARSLSHPNIVRIFNFEQLNSNQCYLTMEYVEGCTLRELLNDSEQGQLPYEVALKILFEVSKGLSSAHEKGVIHGGLTPENILISANGDIKISDFGLRSALSADVGFTVTGENIAVPSYMAPEEFERGEQSVQSDIYSLGIILFEMLNGELPFNTDKFIDVARAHMVEEAPPLDRHLESVPLWLSEVWDRSVAKNLEQRFGRVIEFRDRIAENFEEINSDDATLAVRRLHPLNNRFYLKKAWLVFFFVIVLGIGTPWLLGQRKHRSQLGQIILRIEQALNIDLEPIKPYAYLNGSLKEPQKIFSAVRGGDEDTLRAMLLAGVGPDIKDENGSPLLHLVVSRVYDKGMEAMLAHNPDLEIEDSEGNTAVFFAPFGKNVGYVVFDHLLSSGANINHQNHRGNSALHHAILRGNSLRVERLIERNIKLDLRNYSGRTALMAGIADFGSADSLKRSIEKLLESGADIFARDDDGMTALLLAAKQGLFEISKLLIENGANVEDRDVRNRSVLDYAKEARHFKMVEFLRARIAEVK